MSFGTTWDIEKYKSDFESEDHWTLRRDFMLAHKNKFPEERLVCLAQVFFNVEFLGCKYPEKTMKLIEELSKEIAAEHRKLKKNKLQRTFVGASDAAEAKIKRLNRSAVSKTVLENEDKQCGRQIKSIADDLVKVELCNESKQDANDNSSKGIGYITDTLKNKYFVRPSGAKGQSFVPSTSNDTDINTDINKSAAFGTWGNYCNNYRVMFKIDEIRKTTGPCGNLVVFVRDGEHPNDSLCLTSRQWQKMKKLTLVKEKVMWIASVEFDFVKLSSFSHPDKATAKRVAGEMALNKLMHWYYTVKIKHRFCGGDEVVKMTGKERIDDQGSSTGLTTKINSKCEKFESDHKKDSSLIQIDDVDKPLSDNSNKDEISQKIPLISLDNASGATIKGATDNSVAAQEDSPLEDDNVGLKLLKMMGWSGGGLGKHKQGIVEPIKPVNLGKSRAGFGSAVPSAIKKNAVRKGQKKRKRGVSNPNLTTADDDDEHEDETNDDQDLFPIKKIIRDYRYSNDVNDLVFSPDFTKEQRADLHKYAQRIGLRSKSYGGKIEGNRHLVLSKKIDSWMIIEGLVENADQFYNKYELLRPGKLTMSQKNNSST